LDENDKDYILTLELPGFSSKDIEVTVERNTLYVKAKRGQISADNELKLWSGIDLDKIKGSVKDGLLTVTLPKLEKKKPKRIEIS
jgi:HSP20 family protein